MEHFLCDLVLEQLAAAVISQVRGAVREGCTFHMVFFFSSATFKSEEIVPRQLGWM